MNSATKRRKFEDCCGCMWILRLESYSCLRECPICDATTAIAMILWNYSHIHAKPSIELFFINSSFVKMLLFVYSRSIALPDAAGTHKYDHHGRTARNRIPSTILLERRYVRATRNTFKALILQWRRRDKSTNGFPGRLYSLQLALTLKFEFRQ